MGNWGQSWWQTPEESGGTHIRTGPTSNEAAGLFFHQLPSFLRRHQVSSREVEKTSGIEMGKGNWKLLEMSTMAVGGLIGAQGWTLGTNGQPPMACGKPVLNEDKSRVTT